MMPGRMRLRHALLSALMLLIAIASLPRGLALAKLDSRVGSCGANEVERIVRLRAGARFGLALSIGVLRSTKVRRSERGVPLDARASDSSLAHGSADASGRFGSIDPAAAGYVSSRGVVFVETRFVSRAWQVVDGRLCGWSGPRR